MKTRASERKKSKVKPFAANTTVIKQKDENLIKKKPIANGESTTKRKNKKNKNVVFRVESPYQSEVEKDDSDEEFMLGPRFRRGEYNTKKKKLLAAKLEAGLMSDEENELKDDEAPVLESDQATLTATSQNARRSSRLEKKTVTVIENEIFEKNGPLPVFSKSSKNQKRHRSSETDKDDMQETKGTKQEVNCVNFSKKHKSGMEEKHSEQTPVDERELTPDNQFNTVIEYIQEDDVEVQQNLKEEQIPAPRTDENWTAETEMLLTRNGASDDDITAGADSKLSISSHVTPNCLVEINSPNKVAQTTPPSNPIEEILNQTIAQNIAEEKETISEETDGPSNHVVTDDSVALLNSDQIEVDHEEKIKTTPMQITSQDTQDKTFSEPNLERASFLNELKVIIPKCQLRGNTGTKSDLLMPVSSSATVKPRTWDDVQYELENDETLRMGVWIIAKEPNPERILKLGKCLETYKISKFGAEAFLKQVRSGDTTPLKKGKTCPPKFPITPEENLEFRTNLLKFNNTETLFNQIDLLEVNTSLEENNKREFVVSGRVRFYIIDWRTLVAEAKALLDPKREITVPNHVLRHYLTERLEDLYRNENYYVEKRPLKPKVRSVKSVHNAPKSRKVKHFIKFHDEK